MAPQFNLGAPNGFQSVETSFGESLMGSQSIGPSLWKESYNRDPKYWALIWGNPKYGILIFGGVLSMGPSRWKESNRVLKNIGPTFWGSLMGSKMWGLQFGDESNWVQRIGPLLKGHLIGIQSIEPSFGESLMEKRSGGKAFPTIEPSFERGESNGSPTLLGPHL
jgi:hypothetical protein